MIGLLHRLAARATGTARLVRSDARLPYGGGVLPWADAPRPEPPEPSRMRSNAPGQSPSLPHSQPRRRDAGPPLPEAAASAFWGEALPATTSRAVQDAADDLPAGVPTERQPPLLAGEAWPRLREAPPLPLAGDEASEERRLGHPSAGFEGGAGALSDTPTRPLETARLATPAEPIRLMPRAGEIPAPAIRSVIDAKPQPLFRMEPAASHGDDTAEVHIHIGRIEVTAVHEAPPPRRRQAPVQAPMSLDAYLAKRSRS
ncbi:MAG TPA: hypothetical protein VFQ90_12695 [Stellaceae bacterium]|jgi:hypothetical protein|nr:hypothetical protein [Stellaceae bacterium]